ncbi:VOC family protein [Shewanella marina]|uniref:VOC family protein n=1 Tax=Shewanella marina TaxID=487319 RepID=UPI00046EF275|nr:VOC family protein [Shewanella marina]
MLAITRINHVGLRVNDLDRSRQFYQKLGFEFIVGPIGPEPVAVMVHPSGININFILNSNIDDGVNMLMDVTDKYAGFTHIALQVDNLAMVEQQLIGLGLEISGGPIKVETGAQFLFVRDPDMNVLEFHQTA